MRHYCSKYPKHVPRPPISSVKRDDYLPTSVIFLAALLRYNFFKDFIYVFLGGEGMEKGKETRIR